MGRRWRCRAAPQAPPRQAPSRRADRAAGRAGRAAVVVAVLSVGSESAGVQVSERTVTVSRGVIETVVSGSGNLEPARQADLDFATSGRITKIYTSEGEHVSKGELLARVDDRSARVALAKAQADLVDAQDALDRRARGGRTRATRDGDRGRTSRRADAVAARAPAPARRRRRPRRPRRRPPRHRSAHAAPATATAGAGGGGGAVRRSTQSVESAQAAVESAELALDEAEDELEETRLRAPMAGTVASISGAVGDTAVGSASAAAHDRRPRAPSTRVHRARRASRLKLEVALSEADIGKVEVGQSVTVRSTRPPGEQVAGEVTSVGVLSSSSTSGSVSYPVDGHARPDRGGHPRGDERDRGHRRRPRERRWRCRARRCAARR